MQNQVLQLLEGAGVRYVEFPHEASGPSNLSRDVRSRHGYPNAIGAKALMLSVNFGVEKKKVLCVVHADKQLDKKKLQIVLPNMKTFRFLTKEELFDLTGLVPGSVPPFGKPILNVDLFLLDKNLLNENEIGFNCASLTHTVVMNTTEYLKLVKPDICEVLS